MLEQWLDKDDETEKKARKDEDKDGGTLDKRLFKARSIFIFGPINQNLAREVSQRLVAMATDSDEPIKIYINSQGGHVESGDTIHDMIRFVKADVKVIGTGWVASAGAHIYLAAKKENRFSLPNTRFLLHQPSGGAGGVSADIAIQANEIIKMKQRINRIIAEETGQPLEKVERDTDRDFWLSAEEAKDYGIVHKIIGHIDEVA